MTRDEVGPIGALAADRPLLSNIVAAFGLTALAATGAQTPEAAPLLARFIDFLLIAAALAAAPLALAALAPARLSARISFAVAILLVTSAYFVLRPATWPTPSAAAAPIVIGAAGAGAALALVQPAFGASSRLGIVSSLAALLGVAAALGLFELYIVAEPGPRLGAAAALALALGAATGFAAIADFAESFARGAGRRAASGEAAQDGAVGILYAAAIALTGFFILDGADSGLAFPAFAAAGVLLAASAALIASAGAMALKYPSEELATAENRRRQAFRSFWRPIRRNLPPSSAFAALGVAGVAAIAAAFNPGTALGQGELFFATAAAALAGLIFFSLRAGAFVGAALIACALFDRLAFSLLGAPPLAGSDAAAAFGLVTVLLGQFAVAWKEARSPRLNARETAEAAMGAGFGVYLVGAGAGVAAFLTGAASGLWPGGVDAAAHAGVMLAFGLAIAPVLMTALSALVRRELG